MGNRRNRVWPQALKAASVDEAVAAPANSLRRAAAGALDRDVDLVAGEALTHLRTAPGGFAGMRPRWIFGRRLISEPAPVTRRNWLSAHCQAHGEVKREARRMIKAARSS